MIKKIFIMALAIMSLSLPTFAAGDNHNEQQNQYYCCGGYRHGNGNYDCCYNYDNNN